MPAGFNTSRLQQKFPLQFSFSGSGTVPPSGGGTVNFLRADGSWAVPPGSGVTSVAMTVPTGLAVSGSPITTSGTLAVTWSGTIPNAQIPNPGPSALGGVKSGNAPAFSFVAGIDTSGNLLYQQPSFIDPFVTNTHDTVTGTSFTLSKYVTVLAPSGTLTLTFPAANTVPGQWMVLRHTNNFAVNSATSNIVLLGSTSTTTVIFPASKPTAWGSYQSDGANWVQMMGN